MKFLNICFLFLFLVTQAHTQAYQLYFGNAQGDAVVTLDRVEENLPLAVEYELNLQSLEITFSRALDTAIQVIQEDSELSDSMWTVIQIDGFGTSYEVCESSDPFLPFVTRFDNRILITLSVESALANIRDDMWFKFTNHQ